MFSQLSAAVAQTLLLLAVAAGASSVTFMASDALHAGVTVGRSGVGAVSRADARVASASGSFVSQPPADPAPLASDAVYSSYPPYGPSPYPYPYPHPQLAYSTAAPPASYDETSRLFGNIGHALNPANLFTCPKGSVGCIIAKVASAVFILAGIGLAVYLVYALVTGKLGSFGVGR